MTTASTARVREWRRREHHALALDVADALTDCPQADLLAVLSDVPASALRRMQAALDSRREARLLHRSETGEGDHG